MYRIVTYNVHRCLGIDGRLDPARIADVIASCRPHVVALQEIDVGRTRTGGIDQAQVIAARLGMEMHFHAALRVADERYGHAILSAMPSRLVKCGLFPADVRDPVREPRGALWVSVLMGGMRVEIINTHLGLRRLERQLQVEALLGPDWIGPAIHHHPLILAGDFNALPRSRAYLRIASRLRDVQILASRRSRPTFPSRMPLLRLDHVFVNPAVEVLGVWTVRTKLAVQASDHLPLMVEFKPLAGMPGGEGGA